MQEKIPYQTLVFKLKKNFQNYLPAQFLLSPLAEIAVFEEFDLALKKERKVKVAQKMPFYFLMVRRNEGGPRSDSRRNVIPAARIASQKSIRNRKCSGPVTGS